MSAGMAIPLWQSFLCLDCDVIGDNYDRCPRCSSRALLSLANVLRQMSEGTRTAGKVKDLSCQ